MALTVVRAPFRLALMALAASSLLTGLWVGLVRLGWGLPGAEFAPNHGPLLVAGVLGVVIGLERAVALGRPWAYMAPATAGLGGASLVAGLPMTVTAALFIASSLLVVMIFVRFYQHRPEWATAVMAAGAVAWLTSNLLWFLGRSTPELVPWWAAFLVLTIVGERLELAQVLLSSPVRYALLGASGVLGAGVILSSVLLLPGIQVAGAGLFLLAAWLVRYDIARRTIRRTGLPRFSAVCLLVGYFWLGLAGLFWALGPSGFPGAYWYDAMLHSLFLGFVFSMIFGHAPTIIPAVTGIAVPFQRAFFIHVGLLHGSLLVRIIGDLASSVELRAWGGLANVLAMLVFAVLTVRAARRASQHPIWESASSDRAIGRSAAEERDRCHGPPSSCRLTLKTVLVEPTQRDGARETTAQRA